MFPRCGKVLWGNGAARGGRDFFHGVEKMFPQYGKVLWGNGAAGVGVRGLLEELGDGVVEGGVVGGGEVV